MNTRQSDSFTGEAVATVSSPTRNKSKALQEMRGCQDFNNCEWSGIADALEESTAWTDFALFDSKTSTRDESRDFADTLVIAFAFDDPLALVALVALIVGWNADESQVTRVEEAGIPFGALWLWWD